MQKYDFRVDICSNRHTYKPFTNLCQRKTACGFVWKMHASKKAILPAKSA